MARIRNRRLLADASNGKSRLQRWLAHCGIASGALAPSSRLRPPRRRTCGRSSIAEAAASRRKLSHRLRTISSPDRWHDSEPRFDPRQVPRTPAIRSHQNCCANERWPLVLRRAAPFFCNHILRHGHVEHRFSFAFSSAPSAAQRRKPPARRTWPSICGTSRSVSGACCRYQRSPHTTTPRR